MKITFAGAAETVTGSCNLVQCGDKRLVVDCGMFQGLPEVSERNHKRFPFDPAAIDYVLLTHAHLDHTGRLPLLVKEGFRGRVVTTAATRDLARVIMLDSARIQEQDARRARRKKLDPNEPGGGRALYATDDVMTCLSLFKGKARYNDSIDLGSGITATFRDAGHVIGSAFIELRHRQGGEDKSVTFSGDLGNINKPLVRDPDTRKQAADVIVTETTYGDRNHRPFEESIKELREVVLKTFKRRGSVLIPAFALERSQELLYVLYQMSTAGELGKAKIFLDSPMAIEVTHVFTRHPDCFDAEALAIAEKGGNPFAFKNLRFTQKTSESKSINQARGNSIIVAASGMCSGGRILHHLRLRMGNPDNSIIFIGYQAEGTLGREIVDGAAVVMIHRDSVPVNAEIHTIGGFSGHADKDGLLDWIGSTDLPQKVLLVHGEEHGIKGMAAAIDSRFGIPTYDPNYGETVEI